MSSSSCKRSGPILSEIETQCQLDTLPPLLVLKTNLFKLKQLTKYRSAFRLAGSRFCSAKRLSARHKSA